MPPSKPPSTSPRSRKKFSLFRTQGKIAALRNRLLKEAVIEGVALTALVAAYYMLSDWVEGRTRDRDAATASLSQITTDVDSLEKKLSAAEKALPVLERNFKDPNKPEIDLDRKSATEVLERLKEDYLFATMRVGMSPVKDMEDGRFRTKFENGQYVEVDLSIDALSDEHVLNFLNQVRTELPGKIKILHIGLTRLATPNSTMLGLIAQSGKVGLMRAEIKLLWIGMRPLASAPAGGR